MAKSISPQQLKNTYPDRYFQDIQLPSGLTHYQSTGEGPVIILVHGVSGPLVVWDKTTAALVEAGYRVVRYDLFGRGFSERLPDSSYSLGTYLKQLEELVEALNLGPKIRLIGSSLGGIITTEYTLQHPDRVSGLVLIGPAGFPIITPPAARLREIPIVGDRLSDLLSFKTIVKQNDNYFVADRMPGELRPFVVDQLSVPGTTEAILKTMKNNPVQSFIDSYAALGKSGIPVGLIWGREDETFPYKNSITLLNLVRQAELVSVENSGHLPQYERAEEVNPALVRFEKAFDRQTGERPGAPLSARFGFPKEVTTELNSVPVGNFAAFNQPFFQQIPSVAQDLQLAPGFIKNYLFPTFYDNETTSAALFLCDYNAAAKLLPKSLRPISFLGRAGLMVSSFRYGSVRGIRPYNEVAIAILVQKSSDSGNGMLAFLKSGGKLVTSYVVSMPVTSFENQIRGRKIWGLPKVVQEIDLRQVASEFVTTVYDEQGLPYMEFRVPLSGKNEALKQSVVLYSDLGGVDLVSHSMAEGKSITTMNKKAIVGFGGSETGYSPLSLGASKSADLLRSLRVLPVPVKTIFATAVHSILTLPSPTQ